MSIRIITDSTSDIPWDYAKENNIEVVSLYLIIDGKEFKEDEHFDYDAYYKLFEPEKKFLHVEKLQLFSFVPKTSQPSPNDYTEAYNKVIAEGAKDIIVINVTKGLSGSQNSAVLGAKRVKKQHEEINFHFIDSLSSSHPEVYLVELAVDLINKGLDAEKIAQIVQEQAYNVHTTILLPTLKYLWKGGRLSTSKFVLGAMLRKKPIVTMEPDETVDEHIAHVKPEKAVTNVEEGFEECLIISTNNFSRTPHSFRVVYGSRKDYAEQMKAIINEQLPEIPVSIYRSGGTVLSHLGPESIGLIADYIKYDELPL